MASLAERSLFLRRRTIARLLRAWSKRIHNPARPEIMKRRSDLKVDLFTPMILKDAQVFRFAVRHVRRFLQHPIGEHYVAGPDSPEIRALCKELGCVFVPEEEVVGFGLDRLMPIWNGQNRSRAGWLLQQFLKLNCDAVSDANAILVLDADTVFVSNVALEDAGSYVLQYNDGYMECYDHSTIRLLGTARLSSFSFVCHHMLMQRRLLQAFREELESRFGKSWIDVIIENIRPGDFQALSEYELYGNFACMKEPAEAQAGVLVQRRGGAGSRNGLRGTVRPLPQDPPHRLAALLRA
jgi:hypothetical protein